MAIENAHPCGCCGNQAHPGKQVCHWCARFLKVDPSSGVVRCGSHRRPLTGRRNLKRGT